MTAIVLPNIGLQAGYLDGETGWGAAMNLNLRTIDALMNMRIVDKDLNAPPGSPTSGDTYIIGPAPTGAWATHAGKIAVWQAGDDLTSAWVIVTPKNGWRAYVIDESRFYEYTVAGWLVHEARLVLSLTAASLALASGASTPIPFDTVEVNTMPGTPWVIGSPTNIVIPNGIKQVKIVFRTGYFNGDLTGWRAVFFDKNSASYFGDPGMRIQTLNPAGTQYVTGASADIDVNAGDVLRMLSAHNSGTAVSLNGNKTTWIEVKATRFG